MEAWGSRGRGHLPQFLIARIFIVDTLGCVRESLTLRQIDGFPSSARLGERYDVLVREVATPLGSVVSQCSAHNLYTRNLAPVLSWPGLIDASRRRFVLCFAFISTACRRSGGRVCGERRKSYGVGRSGQQVLLTIIWCVIVHACSVPGEDT